MCKKTREDRQSAVDDFEQSLSSDSIQRLNILVRNLGLAYQFGMDHRHCLSAPAEHYSVERIDEDMKLLHSIDLILTQHEKGGMRRKIVALRHGISEILSRMKRAQTVKSRGGGLYPGY